ncbi:sodium-coupled neutral amino acid transporter 9 isoform X2 [Carassius gibelio]|uniref:sodium-coupled neutral amino acid transporter 9 isoform X2 n=1 Tax=Carassius gibelio TaxID=101364 RepID=UPI002278DC81|nr:sodium-coupled neutral amino acid transporter 9 isoform X2 [Carassius gibelio]
MDEDTKPLLGSGRAGDYYTDSLDPKQRRPFHVEHRNIVGDEVQERVSAEAAALSSRVHYYGRLTASSDRPLVPPDHVIPSLDDLYIYSPLGTAFKVQGGDTPAKNPSIVTIFAIWNTMMGTSILSMPWGIKQAGFTLGIIIIVLMGLLTLYCCYRVLKSRESIHYVHNVNTSDTFGTNGTDRVICPYPNLDPDGDGSTLQYSAGGNSTGAVFDHWWSKTNTIPFYLIVLLLPLLNFRSASFFARFTFLGTLSVVYLIILVTYKAIRLGFHLEFHWFDSSEFFVPEFRSLCPQLTGVLTLAFFIHNCIITLMKNNKHQENNVRDLSLAYLLVGLTYLYVGVLIFAAFPSPPLSKECIEPNFLDNFPSSDVLVFFARTCLLFQMTTVYPLLGYLVRVQLMGQLFGDHYPSFLHVFVLNILVVGAGVLMARFYPNIGSIIRYSGAICGLALVFVLPSLVHMTSLNRRGELRWPSAIFHGSLVLLGVANLFGQFFK